MHLSTLLTPLSHEKTIDINLGGMLFHWTRTPINVWVPI